jgi:hypothetical protein
MSNQNKYAIVIGVGQRADDDKALAITASDAMAVSNKLETACKFPKNQVKLLTGTETGGSKIIDQLDELAQQTKATKADLVIIYFSGHGYTKNGQYYLINYETDKNDIENTAVRGEVFIQKINTIHTDKLLLLLDCCHAGGFAGSQSEKIPFKKEDFLSSANFNRVIITSCEEIEKSFTAEPVSVFTYALIEALHGKDLRNDRKSISVFDLALYVRERTRALTKAAQNPGFNVLPQSLTENFTILEYEQAKPAGNAFEKPFKLYKDSKEINVTSGFADGHDAAFRQVWFNKLNIKEADIGFVEINRAAIATALVEEATFKRATVEELYVKDTAKEDILKNKLLPLKIRIERDKVVYGWKKKVGDMIKDVETEVLYSDADLHMSVTDFFITWAKATEDYNDAAETNFQILGKLLSRFIDLENQLQQNLKLSETLFLEQEKNIKIGVMLEVKDDAGVLCQLPWEYLFIAEKDKGSVTGKTSDDKKMYPPFFLAADKNLQFQFVRQTKRVLVSQLAGNEYSVIVLNSAGLTDEEIKKRIGAEKSNTKISIVPSDIFDDIDDFAAVFIKYIQQVIQDGDATSNYVLHYIGKVNPGNKEPQISIATKKNTEDWIDAAKFAGLFEIDINGYHLPKLIFMDADRSAKTTTANNSVAVQLSYNNIPAVLGFQDELTGDAKVKFINQFYNGVSQGMDVAEATTIARQVLKFSALHANDVKRLHLFGIPVLFISTEIPVKLLLATDVIEKEKEPQRAEHDLVKYCPVCKKEFPFNTNRLSCDEHKNRRFETKKQSSSAEAQQQVTSFPADRGADSASASKNPSLSAKPGNG